MANKKYYWLKLQKDFFKRHEIRIIESMDNGKDYILFYLKLLVESVGHEGRLRFSELIPYNEQMLASITNTNVDVVRSAMKIFQELNMIDVLNDETIYMSEVASMIGSETDWAQKKRAYRLSQKEDNVGTLKDNVRQEIRDKSIEIRDKNIYIKEKVEREKIPYQQIADTYNRLCISYPALKVLSDNRKKAIKARLNNGYTLDDFERLFAMAEESDFLKGKNNRNWSATFDWLIKDSNMAKVLEGNYANKDVDSSENEWIKSWESCL